MLQNLKKNKIIVVWFLYVNFTSRNRGSQVNEGSRHFVLLILDPHTQSVSLNLRLKFYNRTMVGGLA